HRLRGNVWHGFVRSGPARRCVPVKCGSRITVSLHARARKSVSPRSRLPSQELIAAGPAAVYTIAHQLHPSLLGALLPMSDENIDRRLFLGGSAATLGYFFTADAF